MIKLLKICKFLKNFFKIWKNNYSKTIFIFPFYLILFFIKFQKFYRLITLINFII